MTTATADAPAAPSGLRRVLGLPALTFFGVGMILGAGIYAVIGAAAAEAGSQLWMSFLCASVVALLTGLSYAELAAMHPRAGAEFVYLREAAPRIPALALGTALLVGLSGLATCATVALAFSDYLGGLLGWEAGTGPFSAHHLVALALLGASFAVAFSGILQASWVNVIFTLIEIAGLVIVVVLGLGTGEMGSTALEMPDIGSASLGVLGGAGLVFFSFLGFENVATLSEEAKKPETMVPRAVIASILISGTLYVLVALAVVALLPPAELAASATPLTSAVETQSATAGTALSVIALFATANTCLASLVVTSRLVFGIADGGALPSLLKRTSLGKTPWVALLVCLVVAVALTFLGEVPVVARLSSFASLAAFLVVNVAVMVLRKRDPSRARPFRIAGNIAGIPVTAVLGAIATVALIAGMGIEAQLAGGIAVVVVGVIATIVTRAMPAPRAPSGTPAPPS
jgi:amino acid transporter